MLRFFMGFWCGAVVTTLVVCGMQLRLRKIRRKKEMPEETAEKKDKQVSVDYGVSVMAKGAKILLVDDSRLSRTVIKDILGQTGLEFAEAESGAECLRMAESSHCDLVILDHSIPGISSAEVLQRLRRIGEYKRVPVIITGAAVNKENEKEFLDKGFSDYLTKPIQSTRLGELLLKWLPSEKLIQKPDGFSYQNGLKNFDGNTEGYEETLLLFAQLWEERKEQLADFLKSEDMGEYAILIHAIKGDARTLGADFLAKLAYEQELAAKAGDLDSVKNTYRRVIMTGDKTAEYFTYLCS